MPEDVDREVVAAELERAAAVLKDGAKRVAGARKPMSEAEFGQRLWGAQGFVKPPKPPQR